MSSAVPVPELEMQPVVVGRRTAQGWRVAMLRGGQTIAELEPYQARALAVELVSTANALDLGPQLVMGAAP